ncbi:MAG: hypothetical protein E6I91_10255 [Chloroflexi bacterium]|nr:MAG: hypothetical protein E6I91_10255 [Chloroflexota bacterium]
MKTFDEWNATLLQDMADIRRLEGIGTLFERVRLFQRVRTIGRHCYQTEEELSVLELHTLKRDLEISEPQWQLYKVVSVKKTSSRLSLFLTMRFLSQAFCKRCEQHSLLYLLLQYKR